MAVRQIKLSNIVGKGYADFWQASQRFDNVPCHAAVEKRNTVFFFGECRINGLFARS